MKKQYVNILMVVLIGLMLNACAAQHATSQYAICPVCNKTVDKDDAYTRKYKGTKYYFDKSSCELLFKKNPKNFVAKKNKMTK